MQRMSGQRARGRWPGELLRGGIAALAVAGAIELVLTLAGKTPDPALWELVAVVYAASVGDIPAGAAAIVVALAYCVYFFSSHRYAAPSGELFRLIAFLVISLFSAGLVIVLRRRANLASLGVLRQEQGRSAAAERASSERLSEQSALNQTVINSLPAHLAVLDPTGRIVSTNLAWDRFAARSGGQPSEVGMGTDYLAACPSDAPHVAQGIRDVLQGRVPSFSTEYPCDTPQEKKWFLLTVTPLQGSRGAVVAHIDISQRKAAEDSLRRRAEEMSGHAAALKRINDELEQFAYVTSHDLRAPLRGIANLSSWIEEDMGPNFTPEAHQQMILLRGRVHRMEAMIDGILEYSRVGRVRGQIQDIDTAMLLAETIDLLDPPAHFTIEVQPGMPVVRGEKLRLQQVFMNLIGNAIKHHDKPEGRITVGCRDAGEFYDFWVFDNGPGIEPQYFEKIFVIFQTLQPRDKVEGTGVGLSLVKKIVEHAGGTVTVDSTVGGGTTFRFTWPRQMDEVERTARGDAPTP